MRKQIIQPSLQNASAATQPWLDLDRLAQVQITSEEETHPIELALIPGDEPTGTPEPGWIAAQSGKQTIRLSFDEPQRIIKIHLLFREAEQNRTQEFLIRYSKDQGQSFQEILRQQYNFSPPDTTTQLEEYSVGLEGITTFELTIIPDINGGNARASLVRLRLA